MAEDENDKPTPQWLIDFEDRMKSRQGRLGHEIGAGAPCFKCIDACPGLDLHFWRKKCKICQCSQDEHDIPEDDEIVHKLLFKAKESKSYYLQRYNIGKAVSQQKKIAQLNCLRTMPRALTPFMRQLEEDSTIKKFDWIPPNTSKELADDYMQALPIHIVPISGTTGAIYRRRQLKKQIPIHDILPNTAARLNPPEQIEFYKYVDQLRSNAGIGQIQRIKLKKYCESSQPYHGQCATQSSKNIAPNNPNLMSDLENQDNKLINNLKNINVSCCRPPIRLMAPHEFIDATPNTAMANLPQFIPTSILRLPSEFKQQRLQCVGQEFHPGNYDLQPLNNNEKQSTENPMSLGKTKDKCNCFGLSGIHPLPPDQSQEEEGDSSVSSYTISGFGTSTPIPADGLEIAKVTEELTEERTTPKWAHRLSYDESNFGCSLSKDTVHQKGHQKECDFATSLDSENANNTGNVACALPVAKNVDVLPVAKNVDVLSTEKILHCAHCQEQIAFDSVAVITDKAGPNMIWHPKCFVCNVCEELLVDLMYFHHNGLIYCGRHYAEKLKIRRCFACDELIFVKEYTFAEEHYYHIEHFCCIECDVELAGKEYVMIEDHPICLMCYEKGFSKNCQTCTLRIRPFQKGIRLKGFDWHATSDCFKCTIDSCAKSLVGQKFMLKRGKPFCSGPCYAVFLSTICRLPN